LKVDNFVVYIFYNALLTEFVIAGPKNYHISLLYIQLTDGTQLSSPSLRVYDLNNSGDY
jgi:hypothetical protein